MALLWDRQISSIVPGIKRTRSTGRREFLCGVPRPYTWPQPTFLGAASETCPREQIARFAATFSAFGPAAERVAEAMRRVFLHGVPPTGMGWKEADRALKAHGGVGSKATFYRARKINIAARQSQG
jgi:hypothetical protein